MYELWCGVILRDVNNNNKKLNNIYYIIFLKNVNKHIFIKQRSIEYQNESKLIVATFVSKTDM